MSASTKAGLSRDIIAGAALDITDDGGLDGLSMRKLGNQLGVEAMSLYHYVANKDDLLDAVLDRLYAEIELPVDVPDEQWETAIRLGLQSFHDVLVSHEAALSLFSGRPAKSKDAFAVLMWAHNRFLLVGLDAVRAQQALYFAVSFVMGHVASELGTMALIRNEAGFDSDNVDDPEVAEFIRQTQHLTGADMFSAGLDAVVAGLRSAYNLP
ncbi:MAG: TetR family transcriptional regulator [Actinomycetia bacterium]|nr:TetR family transcriptional regulator [Actinomycetes bacterium]MCP4223398.1 TetR family transcriptional regulator [Actinomycetes bacterium]MCP5032892.1 TetR family transcriptional regulator [Actinomycetes bacterium]